MPGARPNKAQRAKSERNFKPFCDLKLVQKQRRGAEQPLIRRSNKGQLVKAGLFVRAESGCVRSLGVICGRAEKRDQPAEGRAAPR